MRRPPAPPTVHSFSPAGSWADGVTHWLGPAADRPPWRLAVLAFLLCLPLVVFNGAPGKDTSVFYSPLIRELGEGNWAHGFHPLVPPLHTLVGAPFAALGLDGFTAAKLAAALFLALTILPLFGIVRRFWTAETAVWACLLGMLGGGALRLVGGGLLDCGKMFFLVLTVYALCRLWREDRWSLYLMLAAGAAGLALIRGEGVAFSALAFACAGATLAVRRRLWREGVRLAAAGVLALLAVAPWLAWEIQATGYPVTDARQVGYARTAATILGLQSRLPSASVPKSFEARLRSVFPAPRSPEQRLRKAPPRALGALLGEVWGGFFPLYLPLFALGIVAAWRRREWLAERRLLLGWAFGHAVVVFLILYSSSPDAITKRYFAPAVPLLLGWCAAGLLLGTEWLRKRRPQLARALPVVLAACAAGLLWSGFAALHESKAKRQETQAVLAGGKWLREEGSRMMPPDAPRLVSTRATFHNGRLPVVLSFNRQLPFWGRADAVLPHEIGRVMTPAELLAVCRVLGVQFVVWDPNLAAIFCPGLGEAGQSGDFDPARLPPGLVVCCDLRSIAPKNPMLILGVQANLPH